MMRICVAGTEGRALKVLEVDNGPRAVVRYVSLAIDVTRCVRAVGAERQKKHSLGVGGARRERLDGR